VYPCRKGITIQQYVVHIVSSAEHVTCFILKTNEVWVKIVRQTDDNLYRYYFVLLIYYIYVRHHYFLSVKILKYGMEVPLFYFPTCS
jgi:hypothetical protein